MATIDQLTIKFIADTAELINGANSVNDALEKISDTAKKTDEAFKNAFESGDFGEASVGLNTLYDDMDKCAEEAQVLSDSMKQAGEEGAKAFDGLSQKVADVGNSMKTTGDGLKDVGGALTTTVTAPMLAVGAGLGVVTAQAMDFETGMKEVFTLIPNITGEASDKMIQDVLAFSQEMGVSTDEVVPALYQALSAGVPAENVFSFLETATKASIGGVTDVETTVDGLTTVVNSYGSDVISVQQASDIMFQTVKLGKTEFDELAAYMYEVTPTASALGISFEEVGAAMAAMTAQGVPTRVAGTQLRALLDELSQANSQTAQSFEQMAGVSFADFIEQGGTLEEALQIMSDGIGKAVPDAAKLQQAMMDLADPTSNLAKEFEAVSGKSFKEFQEAGGTAQQALDMIGFSTGDVTEKMKDYFTSVEAGNAALMLTGKGAETFTKFNDEMNNSLGSTDAAFQKMEEATSRSMDEIKTSFNNAAIEIGYTFLPIIKDDLVPIITDTLVPALEDYVIPAIAAVAEWFGNLSGPMQIAILAFAAFVTALGPVLVVIGAVVGAVGTIATAFGSGGVLAGALTFVAGLISGPVLLAIGALAAAAYLIYENWDTVGPLFEATFEAIRGVVEPVVNAVIFAIQYMYDQIRNVFSLISNVLHENWSAAWQDVRNIVSTNGNAITTIVRTIFSGIYNDIVERLNAVRNFISTVWNAIRTDISTVLNAIQTVIVSIWDAICNHINTSMNTIRNLINTAWNDIHTLIVAALNAIHSGVVSAWGDIQSSITTSMNTIRNLIVSAWNTIRTDITTAMNAINTAVSAAWSRIMSTISTGVEGAISAVTGAASRFYTAGSNWIGQLIDGVSSKIPSLMSTISTGVEGAISAVTGAASRFYTAGSNWIGQLIDGVSSKIPSLRSTVDEALSLVGLSSGSSSSSRSGSSSSSRSGSSSSSRSGSSSSSGRPTSGSSAGTQAGNFSTFYDTPQRVSVNINNKAADVTTVTKTVAKAAKSAATVKVR